MQRFPLCRSRLLLALGFLAVGSVIAADAPAPTPPNGVYTKQPDPPVDPAKDKALYTVGYAHLDTQWRWAYPQVVREFIADTLHNNFQLFEKYPDYIFNFSGSRRYEMMREYYPEDYQRLKGYVAAGRWFPCGSSVDEADANVPSLESFVRHVLYGNRYFEKEFGKSSSEFMLPDCFGFPAALPSILAHCGVKGFSTQKLTWGSANGIPFKVGTWIGPDGKSVTAALDPGSYAAGINEDLSRNQGWLARINHTGETSGAYVDYHYYGTGDRGGAPAESGVQWMEHSLTGGGPIRVVSATAERMFNDLTDAQKAKLPTYKGELLLTEHSAGSVTSEAYMKRWNRKNELLADAAERASVAAMYLGGAPYPSRKLYEGWDLLLGSQMHDMLPGTSLPRAYEFCWNDEILAANHFAAVEQDAVGAVAGGMDTSVKENSIPLVVYNPLAMERQDLVEATVTFPGDAPDQVQVVDPAGNTVPAQVLDHGGHTAHVLFQARVPSVGFATYTVQKPSGLTRMSVNPVHVSDQGLENSRYRVTIDANGDVASIFDKNNNEELLAGPARLEFHYEKPKQFPAWNMDWADRQKPAIGYVDGPAKVRVLENGPVRVALEITREARGSRFVQVIRLANGAAGDRVEFANTVDWQSQECSLKASFPLKNANPLASYDDKVGVPTRGNNDPKKYEVPQQQWFDLTGADGKYGVAVLNDSKFGGDKPDDQTMRLTLLYTPGVRNDYQDQATQDFGRHQILYALAGHAGDWRVGNVPAQAARLNQPLAVFQAASHPGNLGREFSLLKVNSGQVAVAALKKAEDGDEVVVRFKELNGSAANDVEISGATAITSAREINGQEHPLGTATVRDGKLVTNMGPFALRAFALRFAPAPAKLTPATSQAVPLAYDGDAVSSQKNRADGSFDHGGVTYPAEQFPDKLQSEGVDFQLGPKDDGQKNVVTCHGQTINLPAGDYNRVYLLASAFDGDTAATFKVGDREVSANVQDWSGFIGQWDRRLWKGDVPELTYSWHNELNGLVPGFIKGNTVAWYASHRHNPQGNEYYQYCYLYKYGFDLPAGVKQITLPNAPRIGVFAVSVAHDDHDTVHPARALYDTLDGEGVHLLPETPAEPQAATSLTKVSVDAGSEAPVIMPGGGQFDDSTVVTIRHPLYWREGGLHYTTDGSEPTAASPVYLEPFRLDAETSVRARMILPSGDKGPEATVRLVIKDTKPPRIAAASTLPEVPEVLVRFSEPVKRESAENTGNYRFDNGVKVVSAKLSPEAMSATLTLAEALPVNSRQSLQASGIQDVSPAGNPMQPTPVEIHATPPVFALADFIANGNESKKIDDRSLPTGGNNPWTINCFVKTDKQPDNRTLIAGFGKVKDDAGHGRYLSKFANGLHFWCANQDVETSAPLKLGEWQMLTATYDGHTLTMYQDGKKVGQGDIVPSNDDASVELAPLDPWDQQRRFTGEIRQFTVWNSALNESTIQLLGRNHP